MKVLKHRCHSHVLCSILATSGAFVACGDGRHEGEILEESKVAEARQPLTRLIGKAFALKQSDNPQALPAEVFGPKRFTRGHGKPKREKVSFKGPACAADTFTMTLDQEGAPAATVILNGKEIFGPKDSRIHGHSKHWQGNKRVERPVELGAENTIVVVLAGKPGGSAIVSIQARGANGPKCPVTKSVGSERAEVRHPSGVGATVAAGTFANATELTIDAASRDTLTTVGFPTEFSMLGGVSVAFGTTPALPVDLFIPAPNAPESVAFFLAQVVEVGSERRLAVVDTASLHNGRLTSNSPPFPGVREPGTYAFIGAPQGTTMAMFHVKESSGQPAPQALIELVGTQSSFLGVTAVDGFAALPIAPGTAGQAVTAIGTSATGKIKGAYAPLPGELVLPLPLPQPIPTIPDLLVEELGLEVEDAPEAGEPCTNEIAVRPSSIPEDPADLFAVGEQLQLVVECLGPPLSDCSSSTQLSDLGLMPLTGFDLNFTWYRAIGNPPPVTVDDEGLITAIHPGLGMVDVTVQKLCIQQVEVNGHRLPYLRWAPRRDARVNPVEVACPPTEIWDDAAQYCRPPVLNVQKTGEAADAGIVISVDVLGSRIDCGSTCSAAFQRNETVILGAGAIPDSNAVLNAWGGACGSFGTSTSGSLVVDSDKSCTVAFSCAPGTTWNTTTKKCGGCANPVNLALGADTTGSSRGWGGGSYPWDMVDGLTKYYDTWAHGLAFTGGTSSWAGEGCGSRQAVVNFSQMRTFDRVLVWHHGDEHVPTAYSVEYWNGSTWLAIGGASTLRSDLRSDTDTWGAVPTETTFAPVTGSAVRFSMNNCNITHGWIYEVEVFGCP